MIHKIFDNKIVVLVAVILTIIMGIISFYGRDYLTSSIFDDKYNFSAVSKISANADGTFFVLDNGAKTILELDRNMQVSKRIDGGSMNSRFYYATHSCKDMDGNAIVSDIIYGNNGNKIERERVLLLRGKRSSIIFDKDYTEYANPPLQYGCIYDLKCDSKGVYFVLHDNGVIYIYRLKEDNTPYIYKQFNCESILNAAAYDEDTGSIVVATRTGHIMVCSSASEEWITVNDYTENMIPASICIQKGKVYYSDLSSSKILSFLISDAIEYKNTRDISVHEFFSHESPFYQLTISDTDEATLYMHDQGIIYSLSEGKLTNIYSAKYSYYCIIILVHIAVVIFVLSALFLALKIINIVIGNIFSSKGREDISRIILFAIGMIVVASIVSYSSITKLLEEQSDSIMKEMIMFTKIMTNEIDGNKINDFGVPDDFRSDSFNEYKRQLDKMIETSYDTGNFYYYIILRPDEENSSFDLIMDYEESKSCGTPVYEWGDNEYTKAVQTESMVCVRGDISSYGSWTYVLNPIYDSQGKISALLEVGTSLDKLTKEHNKYFIDTALAIFATAIVVIMLLVEIMFAVNFYANRHKALYKVDYEGISVPIRLMVFTAYMADCMQDAFIAIMCASLYEKSASGWVSILPKEIAIALPMSLQLFLAAIASLFGGRLTEKRGTRKIMLGGFVLQTAGFALCALFPNYSGILFGKCFIGLGEGLVYVAANTMAAMGKTEESRAKAFADVSAGVLSGVTIGVGLGSVILSMGSYRLVYIVGAIVLAISAFVSMSAENLTMERKEENTQISIVHFLLNKRVWSFFILMIVPFMVALSYRDYFFPLFVEGFGMTEVRIGQIYLFCGLAVLYVGPWLSNTLINRIGAKRSVILAALLMVVAMTCYLLIPSVTAVIAGVAILYFTISFAYTCQYYYFEELPIVSEYGEGKSMGIYSMFESLGQTLGPILFGLALTVGNWRGILILAIGMFILTIIYVALNMGRKKY